MSRPLDIMGIAEIADRLGTTPERVAVWNNRGKLPPADGVINAGRTKVWRATTIAAWIQEEGVK